MENNDMSNVYKGFLFGTIGIIISYILITYGVPYMFPKLTIFEKANSEINNILDVGKKSVPLTLGVCNFDSSSVEINTSHPSSTGYVHLPQSNNLKGGVQFTYTFWLDTKSYNMGDLADRIIFMRGVNNKTYSGYDFPFVACPLVKFGSNIGAANTQDGVNTSYIDILFNTLKKPHAKISLNNDVFEFTRSTNQNPKWFLITLIFQDYFDFNYHERGIQVQSYINDNLVYTDVIKNDSLKVNNSNFYITPNTTSEDDSTTKVTNSLYADITYHNYALTINDIEYIYNMGVVDETNACTTAKTKSIRLSDKYQNLSKNAFLDI